MKVIHNGTQVTSSFSIIDEDGDVVQSIVVQAHQEKEDPLRFNKITPENFERAFNALIEIKANMDKEVAEKVKAMKIEKKAPKDVEKSV